jgi:hypothetical protein
MLRLLALLFFGIVFFTILAGLLGVSIGLKTNEINLFDVLIQKSDFPQSLLLLYLLIVHIHTF